MSLNLNDIQISFGYIFELIKSSLVCYIIKLNNKKYL